jgi:NADPH-dependent ferric siderophore reductase
VTSTEVRSPRLLRVRLGGPELVGMPVPEPAASVRILLPSPSAGGDATDLVIPTWNGNEFLLPDGSRPILRTLTPWRDDSAGDTLAVDVVLHGTGPLAEWAARTEPGDRVALSGPGRGSAPEAPAPAHLLLGDESALPALEQVLATLVPVTRASVAAAGSVVSVVVEIDDNSARLPIAPAAVAGPHVEWRVRELGAPPGEQLVDAASTAMLPEGARVWAAGEAAAMQRIRRVLFETRGIPRGRTVVRGYWKVARG